MDALFHAKIAFMALLGFSLVVAGPKETPSRYLAASACLIGYAVLIAIFDGVAPYDALMLRKDFGNMAPFFLISGYWLILAVAVSALRKRDKHEQ